METRIDRHIATSPEAVRAILTDARRPSEGLGIRSLIGQIVPGGRLVLRSGFGPDRAFRLAVTRLTAPSEMVWEGGMTLGLFHGRRRFAPTPEAGGSRFTMVNRCSGRLAGPINRSMPDLTPGIEAFAVGPERTCT